MIETNLRAYLQLAQKPIFESEFSFDQELSCPAVRTWIFKNFDVKNPVVIIGDPEEKQPLCKIILKERDSKSGKLIYVGSYEDKDFFINCTLTPGKSVNRPGLGITFVLQTLEDEKEVSLPRGWK